MSKEERDTILQMLTEGKVSAAEAGDLLDALETKTEAEKEPEPAGRGWESRRDRDRERERRHRHDADWEQFLPRRRHAHRGLLIRVQEGGETRTRVHIPLGMALAAGKFIPKKVQDYFEPYGISVKEILDEVAQDEYKTGEIVDVNDGESRVQIIIT